jgi:DnaJ-class molecular chaperone
VTVWRHMACYSCGGHGQVSDYGAGYDFYGPKECSDCGGSGTLSVTDKGAIAAYPGGPFRGRLTKNEMLARR